MLLEIAVALYCPVLLGAQMRNCDVAFLPTSLQCKSRSDVLRHKMSIAACVSGAPHSLVDPRLLSHW